MNNNTAVKPDHHAIDKILADLTVFIEPKLLKDDIESLIDFSKIDNESLQKYRQLLSNVKYSWQKVLRYEVFFAQFYSKSEQVDDVEALNHHMHAYLQDLDTLKNKILHLLGELKKDLKSIASNKDEVVEFVEAGKQKTLEVFDGVLKHRHPHVHNGMRFMDGDLLKAENAHETIKLFTETPMAEMLNPSYKDEWFDKLSKEKEESFETAKKRWVDMAKTNDEQTSGYLEDLFKTLRPSLNQFLNIRPVMEIMQENDAK